MHSQNPSPKSLLLHHPLSQEIIEEIVSRLPVKSVLRFRCVSKSWLSLVESNRFVKIHYQNSTKNTSLARHRVVFHNGDEVMSGCSLQSLLNSHSSSSSSSSSSCISSIVDPTDEGGVLLVGCCYGVLCLLSTKTFDDDASFWLWNPATKVLMELPKLLLSTSISFSVKYGFGWDESSGAFKVCASWHHPMERSTSGHVYSSKTNSWKTAPLPVPFLSPLNLFGVFVCGRIHWSMCHAVEQKQYAIECFNLGNDEFERLELPPSTIAGWRDTLLGEIGGCLCNLFDYEESVHVWIMKEYGVKDSWFKWLTFSLLPLTLNVSLSISYIFSPIVGEGVNGEIFIICSTSNTLVIYSPKHKHEHGHEVFANVITNIDNSCGAIVYVESLVSPVGIA